MVPSDCPKRFGDRLVHRQIGPFSHLGNVRETRHCRVQGPEPDRPLNTKAHLPFSQNRCCEPLQRWPVCQWNREWYTGSVFSGYRSKYYHNSDPARSPASTPSQLEHVLDTMKLADGRSSSFLGRGKMTIALGDRKLVHTIWVAEIDPEGILGLD